jgi:hypothetical protein
MAEILVHCKIKVLALPSVLSRPLKREACLNIRIRVRCGIGCRLSCAHANRLCGTYSLQAK